MNDTSVSVVIPCFNRETTVRDAVESVLSQNYPILEVIAVDDRSTDGTIAVLESITDTRLRVVTNTGPKGPSGARNHGASLARADWIAFQDSDDIWLPGKLEQQMAKVSGTDYLAVYCGMLVKADADPATPAHGRHPDPKISPLDGDLLPSLSRESYISTQMLAVRRDVFEDVGGFDSDLQAMEDWDLMLQIAMRGNIGFVDADLVVQRMSPNSITRSTQKRLDAQEYILEKNRALLERFPASIAFHHHRLAGAYRNFGRLDLAARHAAESWRWQRTNMRYLVNTTYLRLRSLLS